MINRKLSLVDEYTSPLFRIMWIHNQDEPDKRVFENNISAFHIGGGYVLSVAHNLRMEAPLFRSMDETMYRAEILPQLDREQLKLFENSYIRNANSHKRYLKPGISQAEMKQLTEKLNRISFDKRWITLMQKNFCHPWMIVQFRENYFYRDPKLTGNFQQSTYIYEQPINRHTFLLKLELAAAWFDSDIALYRIVDTPKEVIDALPTIEIDFSILEDNTPEMYCLQSAPQNELGRLLNRAAIDGYLDNFTFVPDRFAGNYIMDGRRYLIRGYFRFGSSGAPYIFFNEDEGVFRVNAIQSEACPIQLAIGNSREGNFQYVNAIASPLNNVEKELKKLINLPKDLKA